MCGCERHHDPTAECTCYCPEHADQRRYRKRPVVIEAVQWTSPKQGDAIEWWSEDRGSEAVTYHDDVAGPSDPETGEDWGLLEIDTLEGRMTVTPRDWVVCGVHGEFYAIKPAIFAATYEPAED